MVKGYEHIFTITPHLIIEKKMIFIMIEQGGNNGTLTVNNAEIKLQVIALVHMMIIQLLSL